jgi:hypothetical protein
MKTIIEILRENKDHLRFSQIDKALDMSIGTTARVVRGDEYRNFSEEQEQIIREYLAKLGSKIKA